MKYTILLAGGVTVAAFLLSGKSFARGAAPAAARAGGAAAGARAGGGAAAARPAASPAFNASPSMSRAAAPVQRPAQTGQGLAAQRPAQTGQGLAAQRPAQVGQGIAAQRPAQVGQGAAVQRPAAEPFQRPSQNQLGNFLNLPQAPQAAARPATPAPPMPSQLPAGGQGIQSKSITTPGGSTITVAGGRGSGTTAGGATIGGAGAGVKVEGAGGNTYVKGIGAAGVSKNGNALVNVRGGYADSSGYRQGASLTAARSQWGYTAVTARVGYGANGTGHIAAIAGIRGPAGNVITAGRGASFVNGQFAGGRAWVAVNGSFTRWGCFTPAWYARYPGCWWPGKWAIARTAWARVGWAVAGPYCGCTGNTYYYDYGGNVTYQEGNVYYDDQPVATAEQYYDQAEQLADAGKETQNEEWLPLGVYAVVAEPSQTQTDKVLQLAVNKDGVIRGNFEDSLTDKAIPVIGSVDKTTQRVALQMEGNHSIIVETGLYNLTNDEVPVLVHFGPDHQEPRTLIRLKQPEDQAAAAQPQ